ncbi:MAG: hypothetical protein KAU28_05025, partial [Phycisphaerae bacterium]|nr:hypothetical protein [Phycisphaerae bacterium]
LKGDGTLAGRARTFLSYSTSLTRVALGVLTVFFTVAAVSEDVRTRMIFTVAVKPVARWQYILGRWLGVMTLNAMLLAAASAGIYGMAMYLRTGALTEAINARDRAAVETEVFTARRRVSPVPKDIDGEVLRRLDELRKSGRYDETMERFAVRYGPDEAEQRLYAEIHNQVVQASQSIRPGGILQWWFRGINVAGRDYRGQGKVTRIHRDSRRMRIETDSNVIGRLVFDGPVLVNGVEARVAQLQTDAFDVRFQAEEFTAPAVALAKAGDEVELTVEPTIQITYKASAATYPPDGRLRSWWQIASPAGDMAVLERNDTVRQPATLTLPARVVGQAVDLSKWVEYRAGEIAREQGVDKDQARRQARRETPPPVDGAPAGTVTWATDVRYVNLPHPLTGDVTSVTILDEDISVLFRAGGFEANFARGAALILIQLAYVAALGVLAGSFLTFPVGCLMVFTLLPFSVFRQYLTEAVQPTPAGKLDWYIWPGRVVVRALASLLPDLEGSSPGEWLVDGMYIAWSFVDQAALGTLLGRAGLALAFACLIFRSHELARVQV